MDASALPPVDFNEALKQFDGDRDYMNELFAEFAAGLPARMDEIRAALAEGSAERLFQRAHSLKGASLTFCAQPLAEAARRIEEAGRVGDMSNMRGLAADLEEEASRLLRYVADYLSK